MDRQLETPPPPLATTREPSPGRRGLAAMAALTTVLLAVFVLVAALLISAYTGAFDVSATADDSAAVAWFLGTAKESAVREQASSIDIPPLDDPARVQRGALAYDTTCVTCHGAPGVERPAIGAGLQSPAPPHLYEPEELFTEGQPAQVFWVVKHGIRLSGMPAFGVTHDDEALWDVAAFVRQLPQLSPQEYAAAVAEARAAGGDQDHGGAGHGR